LKEDSVAVWKKKEDANLFGEIFFENSGQKDVD
jgi:hypothetical protein